MPTAVAEQSKAAISWKRCWLEGAGAAILLVPGVLWSQLSPAHEDAFHRLMPQNTITRSIAVDLLLLSFVGMLGVLGIESIVRWESQSHHLQRRPLASLLWALWLGALAAEGVSGLLFAQIVRWHWLSELRAFLILSEVLLVLWIASPRWYQRSIRYLRYGLMLLGLCIFWMVPVLLAESLEQQPWDRAQIVRPVPAAAAQHQRIVWLLFDGMSYDQMFDHRWPGLQLPSFDRLHQASVTFGSLNPEGRFTENVIPALFLGRHVVRVQMTLSGTMNFLERPEADWQPFDSSETIFSDAKRLGWTTGVAGWFNPYCRVLPKQLDFCWMQLPPFPDHLSRNNSTLQNVLAPLIGDWTASVPGPGARTGNLLDQLEFMDPDQHLVENANINFAFVHLPIPHAPNRYNRRTGKLEPNGSYLDNLALSDLVLGRLLADLQKSGTADRTTLILSSDHGWRVWMWRNNIGWTHEDELASGGGKFDDRPMLMVHFPGEEHASVIDRHIPLLNMHGMIEGMLAGQIENRQQLDQWAAQQ